MILITHLKNTKLRRWAHFLAMLDKWHPLFCEVRPPEMGTNLVAEGRVRVAGAAASTLFCVLGMGRRLGFPFPSFALLYAGVRVTELTDILPSLSL